MNRNPKHITFFIGTLAGGGAERVILNLTREFIRNGITIDLLVTKFKGPLTTLVPDSVNVIELEKSSRADVAKVVFKLPLSAWYAALVWLFIDGPKVIRRLPALIDYLNHSSPDVVLSTLDAVNICLLWAKYLSHSESRFIIRQAIFHSQQVNHAQSIFAGKLLTRLVKKWYPSADKIISLTNQMAEDLQESCNIPAAKINTVYNPVDIDAILARRNEAPENLPQLTSGAAMIMAAGRLCKQKNFPALLQAIRVLKPRRKVALVILGEGPDRPLLEKVIEDLRLKDNVHLLGHVKNPYAYMTQADVFVLTSLWEGLPNVIIEALACGCRVVSTDCPSGPGEILQQGKYGKLVPLNDVMALANAIDDSLKENIDRQAVFSRAKDFSLQKISRQYISHMSG